MTSFQYASPLAIRTDNSPITGPTPINHSCGICGREFLKESGLKRHQKVHINTTAENNGPSFHCHICRLVFNCPNQYSEHVKLHHSQSQALKCSNCACFRPVTANCQTNPFKCESCCRTSISTLNNQVPPNSIQITTSAAQYENQSVTEVPETTNTRKRSKKEKQVHYPVQTLESKMKPYQCSQCGKGFSHSSTLAMHKKIHAGIYKYMCEFCHKKFFLNEYYTRHIRVHTKEKPYRCDLCDKSFSQSNTLTQHRRIHTGEKPYSCPECSRLFSVRDYLNKHMRTHTGEKPYICDICDRKYSQASGLRTHRKSHTIRDLPQANQNEIDLKPSMMMSGNSL
ncbi:Zinc finger protein [Pseudolycoriella hygida]|uniref:Zinc finger protein n=1 Tax=Pseudolycoriella hygida TaxID=35572 RepID=A0A9Q0NFZ6_9DIPT|nr:Zinc finger protein [Pseudolycoriella hygida]